MARRWEEVRCWSLEQIGRIIVVTQLLIIQFSSKHYTCQFVQSPICLFLKTVVGRLLGYQDFTDDSD